MATQKEYYCVYCTQYRAVEDWSWWLKHRSEGRKCDKCHNDESIKELAKNEEIERKEKRLANKGKKKRDSITKEAAKNKCEIRRRIDEFNDAKLLKELEL